MLVAFALAALIGSAYGVYRFLFSRAAEEQVNAYQRVIECATLICSHDLNEIQAFLKKHGQKSTRLEASDALVVGVSALASTSPSALVGMGDVQMDCVERLCRRADDLLGNLQSHSKI